MNYKKINLKLSKVEIAYLIFCCGFYFIWAIVKPFNYAPDEHMRYAVSQFFYLNNRLPVGTELLSEQWGFSYAHLPTMLCSLLSYLPMKLVGMFTQDEFALVVAARTVSVLSGTGVVYFIMKSARLLFGFPVKWVMVIFVSMIPQFVFLSSYVNNDIVALLGCSIILYAWVLGMKYNWDLKNCLFLAVGIVICALAYYNSYGWILCSIIFFIGSYLLQNPKDYRGMFKYGLLISVIVLVCISYMFIRHLVLYGDLLGLSTVKEYGELYAIDSLKPSQHVTCIGQGISLHYMLFDMQWLKLTWLSSIEILGYMSVYAAKYVYYLYSLLAIIGLIGCIWWGVKRITSKNTIEAKEILFLICIFICLVIPIFLSIYYSYTSGFQPQGRYCYPALFSFTLIMTKGLETILNKIKLETIRYLVIGMYSGICITTILTEFFYTYLPS